jgi:hypothetical protein
LFFNNKGVKRFSVILLFLFLAGARSFPQDYVTAIGLRGGTAVGINLKYFLTINSSLEAIAATRERGYLFTGLYEIQTRAFRVRHFYWYYGGGAHAGYWRYYDGIKWIDPGEDALVVGIDGIAGLEYNIMEFPVTISLDMKPAINFLGYSKPWFDTAISLRYQIN